MKSYFNGVMAFILRFYKKVSITDVFLGFPDKSNSLIPVSITKWFIFRSLFLLWNL